jgi:hypothetical protein
MGYWGPPPPSYYNPAPRPLRHHQAVVNGETLEYPEPEDEEFFGIGTSDDPKAEPLYAGPYGMAAVGIGVRTGNVVRTFRGYWDLGKNDQSPLERLHIYNRLIAIRAPEDPLSGGLAPDWLEPDGTIHMNYFDFSDMHEPKRKEVVFHPKPEGGVDMTIFEWNVGDQKWGGEGFDAERDFNKALGPILIALQVVTTAIVSIFASPAVGAAWGAAFQPGIDAAAGKAPPSIGEAFGSVAAMGGATNLGALMASDDGKNLMSGLYKSIGLQGSGEFLQKLKKVAGDAVGSLPRVDLAGALAGAIPDELIALDIQNSGELGPHLPGSHSDIFSKAATAYAAIARGSPSEVFYSIRKTMGDANATAEFDVNYAVLYGESQTGPLLDPMLHSPSAVAYGALAASGLVFGPSRQARQLVQPRDRGAMSYLARQAMSAGGVRDVVRKKSATKTGLGLAAVGVVLAALVKKFFF